MDETLLSLLNRVSYFWGYWLLTKKTDYLIGANAFYQDYLKAGGQKNRFTAEIEQEVAKCTI